MSAGPGRTYDAAAELQEALRRHDIRLAVVVAEVGLWAHPDVHRSLLATGNAAWFPKIRRYKPGQGEKVGKTPDGGRLDDNSYANLTIKRALGIDRRDLVGWETCHIWPGTCYERSSHTAVANLVLLPRAIAGFSDHDPEIQAALQYRSHELYGWVPEGHEVPQEPVHYPSRWREPLPFGPKVREALRRRRTPGARSMEVSPAPVEVAPTSPPSSSASLHVGDRMDAGELHNVVERIRRWADKPGINAHRIIALVLPAERRGGIPRDRLVDLVGQVTGSKNPYGAVASMMTTKGQHYGRVLIDVGGTVRIHPQVAAEVARHRWR